MTVTARIPATDRAPAASRRDPEGAARLSVAPMMDRTDRHCRAFHRVLSRHTLLYTEMITSAALVHGPAARLLRFAPAEHPVALQLGGSDPGELAEAAAMGAEAGYDEVNLNCGCPSDRVKSGAFGAVLMERPGLVAVCVAAMIAAQPREVTVKCRIGVDDQDPATALPDFLAHLRDAGVARVAIHARKAWLKGLSPKENREIPPLDHDLALRMKDRFPDLHISVNGGIVSLAQAKALLARGFDGVMVGRAAYHEPWDILAPADAALWGGTPGPGPVEAARAMRPYVADHLAGGGRLAEVTRHMLGLFHGRPGSRQWKRVLSERGNAPGAGLDAFDAALEEVTRAAA
ncbi:MAG: tRNA dihydrouridine(20/20a) synthase DusA [Paracoccaceae bacterium]